MMVCTFPASPWREITQRASEDGTNEEDARGRRHCLTRKLKMLPSSGIGGGGAIRFEIEAKARWRANASSTHAVPLTPNLRQPTRHGVAAQFPRNSVVGNSFELSRFFLRPQSLI
eukprot:CAMPEP_0181082072 /NCGR_PEP_ID=MMETSP1071-20121207/3431_1 /TAXON_ID=35127 /ORGANISM="Thalassiosira sp., Strain NH16" /LENGTH=114 /DNA_ID=CAMNT_0023163643 /DNA_START=405 /DNA_END=749 /DNA_ORIENTATION=-